MYREVRRRKMAEAAASGDSAPGTLFCPFRSGLNPAAELAQTASVAWALRHGLVESNAVAPFANAKLARLNARVFLGAPLDRLQLAADWTTFFCCIDDVMESDRRSMFARSALLDALVGSFRTGKRQLDDRLADALTDLSTRMRAVATPDWMEAFTARLEELFVGYVWEAMHRDNALWPSVSAYLKMRATTIGLQPQFLLGELAEGIAIEAEHKAHPLVQRMMLSTSNCVGWANDLFTWEKEREAGEFHNLVRLLADERRISIDEAVVRVVALHNDEVRNFLALEEQLPSFGERDDDVHAFVAMLKSWMRGHLDWAQETGRYRPRGTPRAQGAAATRRARPSR
jgi:hypothetical protein